MDAIHVMYLFAVFGLAFGLMLLLMRWLMPDPLRQRLHHVGAAVPGGASEGRAWQAGMAKLSTLSGPLARLSLPDQQEKKESLRRRFMNAGWRGDAAPALYFGAKTMLALVAPALVWLVLVLTGNSLDQPLALLAVLGAAIGGFYLPDTVLKRMIAVRQRSIIETFPDALDLMTICIEAGLAIDAAISRVAEEMSASAPVLSEELHLVTLELRAGSSKESALRNFAKRTGVDDVESLAATLIQAERFGTGVGQSLRVHSDTLRTKRRQRAEEAAAKVALKLLFPLIFCIFPALLMVLLGPAVIQVYRVLLPAIGG